MATVLPATELTGLQHRGPQLEREGSHLCTGALQQ